MMDGTQTIEPGPMTDAPAPATTPAERFAFVAIGDAVKKRFRKNQHRLFCAARGGTHYGIHVESCDV
jgi:hypothetical protein